MALASLGLRYAPAGSVSKLVDPPESDRVATDEATGIHRIVSSRTVGLTCLAGIIAFSVVGCYAYYPSPSETLEEMRLARVEVLSGATSNDFDRTNRWIPILEGWSRRLEVGYAIRNFELRPYQQMQTFLLRKKLELLEHAVEHAQEYSGKNDADSKHHLALEEEEIRELVLGISQTSIRLGIAFQ